MSDVTDPEQQPAGAEPSATTDASADAATPTPAVTYLEAELFGDDSDAEETPAGDDQPPASSIATEADPADAPEDVNPVVAAAEVERSNEMERDLFGDISSDEDESNRDLSETAAPIAAIAPSSDHAALRAKLEEERRAADRQEAERNEKQRAAEIKADQARRVQKEEAKQEAVKPRAAGSALTHVIPDVTIFTDLKQPAQDDSKQVEAFDPRITLLPLPNVIGIQSEPFDREKYIPESAASQVADGYKDEFGNKRSRVLGVQGSVKLGENVMRWRWKDAAHTERESNTRIVQWSDGSKSLIVGDEVFEVVERVFTGSQATDHYLFAQTMTNQRDDDAMSDEDDGTSADNSAMGLSAGLISGSMKFRVTSIHSKTHMKLTNAATAHHKAMPKMMRATGVKNVEKFTQSQREAARLEEQRMARSNRRGDVAPRGVKDTALDADFLEQDDDEQELEADEEAESSGLASDEPSRPARRSNSRKRNTRRYDDDDKRGKRLAKAKRAQDSGEEDDEDSKPRAKSSKQKRRKAESEEEEEEDAESSEAEAAASEEEEEASEEDMPASKKSGKSKRKKLEEDSD